MKIATIGRSVEEWVGKTQDTMPPPRVRLRIFNRYAGICQITMRRIAAGEKWHLDHIKPLHAGGENRESNMRPVLESAHRGKSADEARTKAKVNRARAKHIGAKPLPVKRIASRGFAKPSDPGKEARIRTKHLAFLEKRRIVT